MVPDYIELGCTATDKINGFSGVVTGITKYLSGCTQALVIPKSLDKDGKVRDGQWYDIQRLTREGDPVVVLNNAATPGPDMEAPKR